MGEAGSLRVLLVEDNPGDADLVRDALMDVPGQRFAIIHVSSLSDAASALGEKGVDAVLLDLNLPESGGMATLRRAKQLPTRAPIIVLSGVLDDRIRVEALQEGAQDVIGKNEPASQLLARALLYSVERYQVAAKGKQIEDLVTVTPDAVIVVDQEGVVRFVNAAGEALFGRSREELVGDLLGFSVREGEASEVEIVGGSSPSIGEMRVVSFEWGGEPALLASIRDVTPERRLSTALLAAQERLGHVLSSSAAILCSRLVSEDDPLSLDFTFRYISPSVTRILGYTVEQAEESGWWVRNLHPDDVATVFETNPGVLWGEAQEHEFRMLHADGTYRWMNVQASTLQDDEGRPSEVVSVWIDVTERRSLQRQLQVAQRMEAVGLLAGGIAHDFNNMLTVVFSTADILLETLPRESALRDDVSDIRAAAERASQLTRQLLAFSRQQVMEPRHVSLNGIVSEASPLIRRLIDADVELVMRLGSDADSVFVDPGQVEQIIINLAVNARDAMPSGGTLTIETANEYLDAEYAAERPYVTAGSFVVLSVSDTGVGMDDSTQARIFEPFFTTKEVGHGTGLGLASVYGIVKQSRGHVHVYSELGTGTSFKVYIPRADSRATSEASRVEAPVLGGTETILFVEDEEAVRKAGARILQKLGYHVLVATQGLEALAIAGEHRGSIDLLVTDVIMPGMGGARLAEEFRAAHPGTSILFVSGYSKDAVTRNGLLAPEATLLQKPYTLSTLGRKVRMILDDQPGFRSLKS